jgi:FkbM family methyltransferase
MQSTTTPSLHKRLKKAKSVYFETFHVCERLLKRWITFFISFDNQLFKRAHFEASASNTDILLSSVGAEKFLVFTWDKEISKNVYANGSYDFQKVIKAVDLLGHDFKLETIIDVGANIGTICIPAVTRGIARSAIAFEPHPDNYRILVSNIYLNNVHTKIQHFNIALGSEDNQILEFELSPLNSGDHRVRVNRDEGIYGESSRKVIRVRSEKLDSAVKTLDKNNTLVWMDTQGYEAFVLSGATRVLEAGVPIVLEFWPYGIHRANSYALLKKYILEYDHFFDLSEEKPIARATSYIDSLHKQLGKNGLLTDILLV